MKIIYIIYCALMIALAAFSAPASADYIIAPDPERADVNRDGIVDALDTLIILMMVQTTQVCADAPEIVSGANDFEIDIYTATDLDSGRFDLTFDSAVVNVRGVSSGEISGKTVPVESWNFTGADTIRVLFNLQGVTRVAGEGQIATISFEIAGTAGDTSVLELSRGSLVDCGSNETPALWFGCEVAIGVPVAVNAPEVVTDAFTATIDVDDILDMNSGQFDLTFDPAVVNVTAVNAGDVSGTTVPIALWRFMDADTIRVLFKLSGASGVSGSGSVATIEFAVSGSQGDTSVLDVADGALSDTGADEIPAVWIDGGVTV